MSRSKRDAQTRSAELRAVLGAKNGQRTVEAARVLVAERDRLRRELADTGKGLAKAWELIAAQEAPQGASDAN
jgi:hypothetical protein